MSRRVRWLANAVLVVVSLVIAMALTEAGLRVFYPQPLGVWHHDRDGLAMHWPGLVTYLPQFGQSVTFNSVGMRDREHAVAKPDGVFRILVLGDSFMEALQVPFEASFPHVLERALERAARRRVEIVNASVSGWGTDDELEYLGTHGMQWGPDLVLVAMTLHNDISDNLRERFHTVRHGFLVQELRESLSSADYALLQFKGFLATRSHAYQLAVRARRAREMRGEERQLNRFVVSLFREEADDELGRGLHLTQLLLERMKAVTEARGARLVVVFIPLAVQVSDSTFAQFARAAGGASRLEMGRPQRLMTSLAEAVGIPVIDLLPGFRQWTTADGGALYTTQEGHWNAQGHRLASKLVTHELIERALVPVMEGPRTTGTVATAWRLR